MSFDTYMNLGGFHIYQRQYIGDILSRYRFYRQTLYHMRILSLATICKSLLYINVLSVVAMIHKIKCQFYHFYVFFYIFLLYYKKFRHEIRHKK